MQGNNSFRYMIRILAGIYILYLAWRLIVGLRSGEASGIVFVIASAVFIFAGVFFIFDALRHIRREAQTGPFEEPKEENLRDEKIHSDTEKTLIQNANVKQQDTEK